ncbi:MAG: hypothetical protein GC159_18845 [Phycisphaera sp.]|nr:hypothetical protein [Phycisphaera sp.]
MSRSAMNGFTTWACAAACALWWSIAPTSAPAGEPTRSVAAEELLPLRPQSARFVIDQGDNAGRKITVRIRADDERWRVDHAHLKDRCVHRADGGALMMSSSVVEADDSELRFTPAVVLLPATLEQGKPITSRAKVRVMNQKGDREKAHGDYTHVVELLGACEAKTPAGRFDVWRVRETERFDLGLASVRVVTTTCYAPGTGIVTQQVEKKVTKLGLFTSTQAYHVSLHEAWQRTDAE